MALRARFNSTIRKIFTVYGPVARFAKGYPVADVESKVRICRPLFNVMRVQVASLAAFLAFIVVSLKNSLAPLGDCRLIGLSLGFAFPSLPSGMIAAHKVLAVIFSTTNRPASDFIIAGPSGKGLEADSACLRSLRTSDIPAFLRAVFRCICSVFFYPIGRLADRACFRDAGISHAFIIPHINPISPDYCAVILERMAHAFPDLEIRRDG